MYFLGIVLERYFLEKNNFSTLYSGIQKICNHKKMIVFLFIRDAYDLDDLRVKLKEHDSIIAINGYDSLIEHNIKASYFDLFIDFSTERADYSPLLKIIDELCHASTAQEKEHATAALKGDKQHIMNS